MIKANVRSRGTLDPKALLQEFKKQAQYVKIGIMEDKTTRSANQPGADSTNAAIARVQEYGYPAKRIPARPFLRPTFQKNRDSYIALFARVLKAARAKPALIGNAMDIIGLKAQADVRKYITAGPQIPPPNAPRYLAYKKSLARKGKSSASPRTLVLSVQMVKAISYAVVKGRSSPSGKKPIIGSRRYGGRP